MRQVLGGGENDGDGSHILRQLLSLNSRLSMLPADVARQVLRILGKKNGLDFPIMEWKTRWKILLYKQAERERTVSIMIEGTHLVMPFQCEVCWMRA